MCECCEVNAAQTHSFLCEDCERYATVMLDDGDSMNPITGGVNPHGKEDQGNSTITEE